MDKPMPVKSKPISRPSKPGALFTSAQIEKSRGAFERIAGLSVLILSLIGTIAAFHGGWTPILAGNWSSSATSWGITAQIILTGLQWWYGQVSRLHPIYLSSLAFDTSLTTIGYGPLIVPMIAPAIAERGLPDPTLAGWILLGIGSLIIAWFPESRLID